MAVGYDAIDPGSIPADIPAPDYALGYVDGRWPSYQGMAEKYPTAVPVSITAIPGSAQSPSAQVCDSESGDYTPEQAAQWALAVRATRVPAIYCSLSMWPACQTACEQAGLRWEDVDWWIAAYPGNGPNLYPNAVGHQWIDQGTYDQSVFVDGWQPGRPVVPPTPPLEEEDMIASTPTGNGYWICKPDGSIFTYGDANYLGGTNPGSQTPMPAGLTATGFAAHPSAQGYWIESSDGGVYAFGAAGYHGGANTP